MRAESFHLLTRSQAARVLVIICLLARVSAAAQDTSVVVDPGMFFPSAENEHRWNLSVGFVTFTTPQDLTGEVRVRVPAGDVHAIHWIGHGLSLDGRLLFQVVQNQLSIGIRWATRIDPVFSLGIGDDQAYWRGNLPVQGFAVQASGWMNYPSLSLGFRSRRDLLFTLKGEGLITTDRAYLIEGKPSGFETDRFSGYAFSLYMEQPFFKKKYITLGFTLANTRFLWTTWSLFQSFERHVLYPQITTALVL
jgi:hypothetical protein